MPDYPDFCLPPNQDVNCPDLPYHDFTVLEPDRYGLDGNPKNGVGCESP